MLVGVVETHGPRRGSRGPARMLERDYPPGRLSTVETDPGLLEQAVVNMLENAIAYSPDSSRSRSPTYEDRANMVISIEDEGPGIPQADLERIFVEIPPLDEPTDRGAPAGRALASASPSARASSKPWADGSSPRARSSPGAARDPDQPAEDHATHRLL